MSVKLMALLVVLSVTACRRDNPLADLPTFIAPLVDRSKCEPVARTVKVTLPASGPFTSCSGAFPTHEGFGLMRDSLGRTVWFARGWRALPRDRAVALLDSLTQQMVKRFGPVTACDQDRRTWTVQGFTLELSLASVGVAIHRPDLTPSLPWHVQFVGRVGPPEPSCPAGL